MPRHMYRPLLRPKAGEAAALSTVATARRARIEPVFRYLDGTPDSVADRIGLAWTGRRAFADGHEHAGAGGAPAGFADFMSRLARAGVAVMPVLSPAAPAGYNNYARRLVGRHAPGAAIRVGPAAARGAAAWTRAQGLAVADVDLIVDLGAIFGVDPALPAAAATATLASVAGAWRSVTVSAGAAPKDFSVLHSGTNAVPRADWLMWRHASAAAGYPVDFGDYATINPDLAEPPGVAMARATVSVRYARDADWLFVKGRQTGGPNGRDMGMQYRAHARTLVATAGFGGIAGCAADDRIARIASGTVSPGNRTTWVAIAVDRHLSLVAERLP